MGTSFNYVILPHRKKKDGTVPVSIRMTHNGRSKYCTTSIALSKSQMTRKMDRITDQRLVDALERKLMEYRKVLSEIPGAEYMDADRLWKVVGDRMREAATGGSFRLDLFEYAERKEKSMERKTAEGYKSSMNALERFLGCRRLDIGAVTYKLLVDFRDFLAAEPSLPNGKARRPSKTKSSRAVSYYLSCLRALHNMAKDEYNQEEVGYVPIPLSPFKKNLIPPQPVTVHRTLSVEQMKAIRDAVLPEGSQAELARDAFLLSFSLIGENSIDLYHATVDEVADGVQTYNRRKTDSVRQDNALMKVRIEPEAAALMERYKGMDGKHLLSFHARYSDHRNFNTMVNKGLKKVAEVVNGSEDGKVPKELNFYYARHTWSTLAHNVCGVDFDTIHQALNHARRGADRVTGIYVERDFTKVWETNRKVLDLLL